MMEIQIYCILCEKSSPEKNYVPKTLVCGHSICSSCIQEVSDLKNFCPRCFTSNGIFKFSLDILIQLKLKTCNNIVENTLSTLKNIRKTENENYDKEVLEDNIEKLEETLKSYQIMGDNYFTETNHFSGNYYKNEQNLYLMVDPTPTKYLQLNGFENRNYFMIEINSLLQNGKTVYVCDVIYELDSENRYFYQWKYGKFNSAEDCIDIHCLSTSSVDEKTACFRLQDLKRCLEFGNCRPFIDFGSGKMFFTLTNSSNLALQFLKLCTGENGPMLKGSTATFNCGTDDTEEIENLPDIESELGDTDLSYCYFKWITTGYRNRIDYDLYDYLHDDGAIFSKDDVIIQSNRNRIYVRKVVDESYLYENVVAKLDTNDDLKDLSDLIDSKIEDCGISVHWSF